MSNILFINKILEHNLDHIPNFFQKEGIIKEEYDKDLDYLMHETLIRLNNQTIRSITIPLSITENFLEFSGLTLGHHIRLTNELNYKNVPLIFIGTIDEKQIVKLSSLSYILFTPQVYYFNIARDGLHETVISIENIISESETGFDFDELLEKIRVDAPANYATHHSITNEWSIYRWATALKIENRKIEIIEKNIGGNLYFKYLKAKYPIKKSEHASILKLREEGNILYIDDEVDKGWETIFKHICNRNEYESIGSDFKQAEDKQEIIEKTIKKVRDFKPDVVILDFRLHDDDFTTTKPEEVTGYKLLTEIKEINRGIQVIILSATNKIWNLLELQQAGADGFILKESPELSVEENYSKDAIELIYKEIDDKLRRAKHLKEIYNKLEIIETLIKELNEVDELFKNSSSANMEIAYKLLYDSFEKDYKFATYEKDSKSETKNNKYINYAYLQLFLIIEEYLKQPTVFEEGDDCCVVHEGKRYFVTRTGGDKISYAIKFKNGHFVIGKSDKGGMINTNFKMSSVLLFKFGCSSSGEQNWTDIYTVRNQKAAHPAEIGIVTFCEINKLLNFMRYIFDKKNFKAVDINRALRPPTMAEKLEQLQSLGNYTVSKSNNKKK